MQLLFLVLVFLVIIVLLALRRPLYQAMLGGIVATVLLYRVPPVEWLRQTAAVFATWDSLAVILSLYLITYLQRMLEARQQIKLAQKDLDGLFHNRRVNAAIAPVFIGLLPSAAAMILCGDIIKDSTDGYLERKEQAVVTTWFRHIPESSLPTYSGVLLMANLSGVPLAQFMAGMVVPVLALIGLGYVFYLRRLPTDPGTPRSENRLKDALHLLQHLWSLLLILVLILVCKLSVVPAILVSIALAALVYRFSGRELLAMVRSAFEPKLLANTVLVLVLKEFIAYTNVLELVPDALSALPVPTYLIFAILFFLGAIISGSNGIIAMGTPMAFAALEGGMPLMVLLMCMVHAAMQLSPTHVCLTVAAEYFQVTLGDLVRRTLPMALLFAALMIGYYNILLLIL